jgi:transaldolase
MKIFLDTACIADIECAVATGLIDGLTTNPSLIAKSQNPSLKDFLQKAKDLVPGPISLEVTATSHQEMLDQAKQFIALVPQSVIKVPLNVEGLKACVALRKKGIPVNVTLCFSSAQALLAARADATYVSPFIGRLDDIGTSGIQRLKEIFDVYKNYTIATKIIAASIRHMYHVIQAAQVGVDIVTLPMHIFFQMYHHPLTEQGIGLFQQDWSTLKNTNL